MSFDSDEKSVEGSRPREAWKIETPTLTYRYTTSEVSVVVGGNTYTPVPGGRSEVSAASVTDPPELTLELPVSNAFVQAHAFGMPPQSLRVTVYRLQGAASVVWYQGEISAFTVKGKKCEVRAASQLSDSLDTTVPSANVQRQCNHALYGQLCTVNRNLVANRKNTTITAVSADGYEITVASVGTIGAKLKSGEAVLDADGDRRLIQDVVGPVLTLSAPFRALTPGVSTVQLYRGCKHDIVDCVTTHNNAVNFGGHPYMPTVNPFQGDIRGNPFL